MYAPHAVAPAQPSPSRAQVVSLSIDFYIRVFVRVYTSAAETKNAATKLAYVYQSQGCESFYLQRVARKVRH